MKTATIIMGLIAIILGGICLSKGKIFFTDGLKISTGIFFNILPILIFAFLISGFIQILLPKELITKWIGEESGFKGIILGCFAGAITPGGPYTSFPIVAAIYNSGASIGTVVAFITAWSLWAVARLPIEIAFIGVKFTVIRVISTLIFPPMAGLIAQLLFSKMR